MGLTLIKTKIISEEVREYMPVFLITGQTNNLRLKFYSGFKKENSKVKAKGSFKLCSTTNKQGVCCKQKTYLDHLVPAAGDNDGVAAVGGEAHTRCPLRMALILQIKGGTYIFSSQDSLFTQH